MFGAENDTSCALGYDVLHELALVREDGDGEYALTRQMCIRDRSYGSLGGLLSDGAGAGGAVIPMKGTRVS